MAYAITETRSVAVAVAIPPIRMDEPPTLPHTLTRRLFLPGAVVAATFLLVGLVSGNGALVVGAFAPVGLAAVAMAVELSRRRSQADRKRWSRAYLSLVNDSTVLINVENIRENRKDHLERGSGSLRKCGDVVEAFHHIYCECAKLHGLYSCSNCCRASARSCR